jgi:hypothetical protein
LHLSASRHGQPGKDGSIDAEANAARQEAMARRLAGVEGLVVVILGGKPDLTQGLRRQAQGVRYVRVATKAYREAAGE